MQKSMAVFILSVLDRKYSFWIKCFQKIKSVSLSRSSVQSNLSMQNLVVFFLFLFMFFFDRKYFDEKKKNIKFDQKKKKIKIVSLSWNLARRLIRICRYQWWRSFLVFSNENIVFLEICSKKSKLFAEAET